MPLKIISKMHYTAILIWRAHVESRDRQTISRCASDAVSSLTLLQWFADEKRSMRV
jgi:hypothetical protein